MSLNAFLKDCPKASMPLELLCSEDPSAPEALYALKEIVNDNIIAIVINHFVYNKNS